MRSQLHQLELVYPPISNQEAEWIKDDPAVQEQISKSNLYFIGQKPETFFLFPPDEEIDHNISQEGKLAFQILCGIRTSFCTLDINAMYDFYGVPNDVNLEFEMGEKNIRIWRLDGDRPEIFDWFTTEKLIFDRSRGKPFILGFDDFADFFTYNLHYVGISKSQTSFERLIVQPHDKRLRILSNEHPLNQGSRVTDEMILFFFRIKSQEMKQYLIDSDFDQLGKNELEDHLRIIADAEKAYVSVIDTKYNEVKFKEYPLSTDGLASSTLNRIAYLIDENITFLTDLVSLVSKRDKLFGSELYADFIAIDFDDNTVELFKA
ncbi:hypothetical protein D3C87_596770 [compost metagenome]